MTVTADQANHAMYVATKHPAFDVAAEVGCLIGRWGCDAHDIKADLNISAKVLGAAIDRLRDHYEVHVIVKQRPRTGGNHRLEWPSETAYMVACRTLDHYWKTVYEEVGP